MTRQGIHIICFMVYPAKKDEEKQSKKIQVLVTPSEYNELKALADSRGQKLSALGRLYFLGLLGNKSKS